MVASAAPESKNDERQPRRSLRRSRIEVLVVNYDFRPTIHRFFGLENTARHPADSDSRVSVMRTWSVGERTALVSRCSGT
jgi:hypothetical protein